MRTCVIFNPTARGEKAKRFRRHLDEIAREATFKLTTTAGDARRLATEAVEEGYETIVAAGGDGTLNEVLNGIGDAPNGFDRARLGVLPLGTVNVFARELALPTKLELAWKIIHEGHESRIDLPSVSFAKNGKQETRYFAQLAGAGLDARAVELVKWQVKKAVGPLAYVLAGMHAILGEPSSIVAQGPNQSETGELILIGNGRLYGGQFNLFPKANLRDGVFDICVFPRVNWLTLARCGPNLLFGGTVPASATKIFQANALTLTSSSPTPIQVDGELIGHLPATLSILPNKLRILIRDQK